MSIRQYLCNPVSWKMERDPIAGASENKGSAFGGFSHITVMLKS